MTLTFFSCAERKLRTTRAASAKPKAEPSPSRTGRSRAPSPHHTCDDGNLEAGSGADSDSDVMQEPCTVCGSSDNAADCLLCDSCDLAVHFACIGLSGVPDGDWSCPWCTKGTTIATKAV